MEPGLADRFVGMLPALAASLHNIGVSPGAITVQINDYREFMRLSGHVAMSVGQVFSSRQACEGFVLHGVRFELRTQPKVWRQPRVRELYVFDTADGTISSIPNRNGV